MGTSGSADEDAIRERILDQARTLGADAIVLGQADVLKSMRAGPMYQSTMGPVGNSYGSSTWGPWGWWSPFSPDAWSVTQGAADQNEWTTYLSGVAIRYEP